MKTPSRRRLLSFGTAILVLAGVVVSRGVVSRAQSNQDIAQWTREQAIPTVALARIVPSDGYQGLTLPGIIQPFNKALIYARVNGYLKSWNADIGTHVEPGQVLALIDAPDLDQQFAQANATLANAKANADIAAITANRNEILAKKYIVAQQVADQTNADATAKKALVEAMQANVRQLEAMQSYKNIVAPFDGVVTARNTDVGALINSGSGGQPLFEIADQDRVRIYVEVPQSLSAGLTPGMKATFDLPQYPGRHFDATLMATSSAVNASSRTMQVQLQADNSDRKLVGGAYCNVQLQVPSDPNLVRIPATAVMAGNRGVQVAVLGDDDKVVLKPVQIGRDLGDVVEVVSGLSLSDRVIDSPPETLQASDTVRLAAANQPSAAQASTTP
jgi:RND family efflux transporter MFP subunit